MTAVWCVAWMAANGPAQAQQPPVSDRRALRVVRKAVRAHGMADLSDVQVTFSFRGTPYRVWLDGPASRYERDVTLEDGRLRLDRLDGWTLTSWVEGEPQDLDVDVMEARRRSINSVAYFALLPRPLLDDAVIATYAGRQALQGGTYHVVDVRFRQEGGGDDHDDHFRYWFDPEDHRIAYLAYTFSRGDGGVRVRAVTGSHEVGGLVLLDHANHGRNVTQDLDAAVRAFDAGELPVVSQIELQDVAVRRDAPVP